MFGKRMGDSLFAMQITEPSAFSYIIPPQITVESDHLLPFRERSKKRFYHLYRFESCSSLSFVDYLFFLPPAIFAENYDIFKYPFLCRGKLKLTVRANMLVSCYKRNHAKL